MNSRTKTASRRVLQFVLVVSLSCLSARVRFAQKASAAEAATQPYAEATANADKIGNELVARGIPGVAIAVAVNGRLAYAQGFGYADLEERVPVWPTTKFRIGSISKSLTATALVQLVEQGKIDLDAPVQKYVPSFPDKGAKITPRLLAGHLAGIRHYKGEEFLISQHYDSVLDALKIFENDPLVGAARHRVSLFELRLRFAERGYRVGIRREFSRLHAAPRVHTARPRGHDARSEPVDY